MGMPPVPPDFGPTGTGPETETQSEAQPESEVQPENETQPDAATSWAFPPTGPIEQPTVVVPPPVTPPDVDAWESRTNFWPVVIAMGFGALVAVTIGAYSGLHDPTGQAFDLAGFSSGLHAKAWLASIAFALAVVQLVSASAMWGRLPGVSGGGRAAGVLHRWSGRLAVLVSLPVAAHCLYALGFQGFDARVLVHSLLGCFFYGIFVCKMIVLTRRDQARWVVPVVGGILFTCLTGLWLTSSLWFFTQSGLSF